MNENSDSSWSRPASLRAILGIAAAYFVLARLGALMILPPGHASSLWPAAGLALAAALLWGDRAWVGIFLGSFVASLSTGLNTGGTVVSVSILQALAIGAGASLQAMLGAYAILRFVHSPLQFTRERDILVFLLLGGPVSCVVSPTLGVVSLSLAGTVSAQDVWFCWFTWWAGDAVGAMVVAPIVWSVSGNRREIPKRRWISVALPLCLLSFLISSLYLFVSDKEQQRIKDEFSLKTELIANQMKEEWDANLDALYSEVGFFEASRDVDRDEFSAFARYWLLRHRGIQALEWVPRVQHAERVHYEEAARRDGYSGFKISERTKDGLMAERTPQPEYFPVFYVEPYQGNEKALGFDLAADENRRNALNQALTTGKPIGTSRITLVQERGTQYGFLVFVPVYDCRAPNPGKKPHGEEFRGFALGAFRIGDAMQVVIGRSEIKGIHVRLTDLTDRPGEQLLYDSEAISTTGDSARAPGMLPSGTPWLVARLDIAERCWQLSFSPTPEYLCAHRSLQSWSILAGGLLFAAGVVAFLLIMTGRTTRIEGLVRERTQALEIEIAEHQQTEDALRESERNYREIFNATSDGLSIHDEAGRLIDVNERVCAMFAYKRARMLERTIQDLSLGEPPYSGAEADAILRRTIEEGPQLVEWTCRRSNGDLFWAEIGLRACEIGGARRLIASVRDVTGRKEGEAALRKSEERFRELAGHIPQVFWMVDMAKDRMLYVNSAYEKIWGRTCESLYRDLHSWMEAIHPDDRETVKETIAHRDSEGHSLEYRIVRPDGQIRWIRDVGFAIGDGTEPSCRFAGIAEDITVRKEAEIALQESETRMRAIADSARDAILMMDSKGSITYWNPAAERILGYTGQEAVGQDLHWLLAPQRYHAAHRAAFSRFLETGQGNAIGKTIELVAHRKGGEEIPVELSLSAVFMGGWQAVGLLRDITERKHAEETLRQSKTGVEKMNEQLEQAVEHARAMALKAEMANKAKSQFLANMSHEIRTPMNGVIGMIELLQHTSLTHEQQEYAQVARSSGEALLSVIDDVLDFSKIEAGKLDLETVDFDLGSMIDDFAQIMALRAHEKGIEFVCLVEPGTPTDLHGDPSRLRQVLINLAGNAIKFTPRGEVIVRAGLESESGSSVTLFFEVRDTGIGIPAEQLGNLFTPFMQVDSSMTRSYGGTGLGLAISRMLVGMMGGRIEVESEVGKGSTFRFSVVVEGRQPAGLLSGQSPDLSKTRILIVDDNAASRRHLSLMLSLWNCPHAEAGSAADALRLLREAQNERSPFRIALIDRQMDGMDGEELGKAIQSDPRLAGTSLVLLTSFGNVNPTPPMPPPGFSAYLRKPIRRAQLQQCLTQLTSEEGGERSSPGELLGKSPERSVQGNEDGMETKRSATPLRILLVEDTPLSRKVAFKMLEKWGHRVDVAENGREAFEAVRDRAYDLVLMDVQMPHMDGLEATSRIRQLPEKRDLAIIAMTAHAMAHERDKCLQAGMNDSVLKPVDWEQLFCKIEDLVQRGRKAEGTVGPDPHRHTELPDEEWLLGEFLNDRVFLGEAITIFNENVSGNLNALARALDLEDRERVVSLAHAMKGELGNFGKGAAYQAALRLEETARRVELTDAESSLEILQREILRLQEHLRVIVS